MGVRRAQYQFTVVRWLEYFEGGQLRRRQGTSAEDSAGFNRATELLWT